MQLKVVLAPKYLEDWRERKWAAGREGVYKEKGEERRTNKGKRDKNSRLIE